MNPIVRILGRVLRLVGISSPEDSLPRHKTTADPPSWRENRPAEPVRNDSEPPGGTGSTT